VLVVRAVCPPAAGPLEGYAAGFDELFSRLAQRRGFREYLTGLLAPRDRNKTLTGLAGAEPVEGAQHAAVQRLQYFLSQSTWDADEVNRRRLELLVNDPATAPHARGVIAIDDSGDRKDGTATAHVGRQWLGRYGKTDNGIVTVTTVWADERVYYPLHAEPYTPAAGFPKKRADPDFRTKLQIAAELMTKAPTAGVTCRAVVGDCFYGDHDDLRAELRQTGWGFVMSLKPSRAPGSTALTPTRRKTPPGPCRGAARTTPVSGARCNAHSATGTPKPGGPPTPNSAGGDPMVTPASSSPRPTRKRCPTRQPGTWPPTCPGPAARTTLQARRTSRPT
jgi:SRSO17 transposase